MSLAGQRSLKPAVVEEQLRRLGRLDTADLPVVVEPVDGDEDGLAWRTRVQYAIDPLGRPGLREHRSHRVVSVACCPIAHPLVQEVPVTSGRWSGTESVEVVAGSGTAERLLVVRPGPGGAGEVPVPGINVVVGPSARPRPGRGGGARAVAQAPRTGERRAVGRGRGWVRQDVQVGSWRRSFRVTGSGFWQVHPGAAPALVGAVVQALDPRPGDVALDLYSGVGLFAAVLADLVAPGGAGPGRVVAVESDPVAVRDARRNLHDLPAVEIVPGRVEAALRAGAVPGGRADVVVLDPPRTGAGREVVEAVAAAAPRTIAYVACDPAALARDLASFTGLGYRVDRVRAFDAFPMTHHVECVASLRRVR